MFFLSEVFWVAVAFCAFVFLVFKPLTRILFGVLDQRAAKIQEELDEALRLKEEAQELLASYQRKQKEVLEEAKEIVAYAEKESQRITEQAEQQLEDAVNKRIELAMEKIANYESGVLQEIRGNAVDIAVSTLRSLVADNMSAEITEELIEAAFSDVSKKLH